MTTQNKDVPRVRFPEFNGDWKETQIGKDITLVSGQHILAENYSENSDGVPYLTGPADFQNGKIVATKFTKKPKSLCKKNDILITVKGSGTGTLIKANKEYCISRQLMAIRPKSWDSDYLYYVMLSQMESFNQISVGLIPGISRDDILLRKILVPNVAEQQKIAAFLTSIDEKIQQLANEKDLLGQYKKSVMEKIFNQEIRFKDDSGKDFADWELIELKEIAVRVTAKNKSNNISKVLTNSATQGIVNQQDYFDKDIANPKNLEGYYIVEKNDFVYNPRISASAPVGPIKRNKLEKGLMSPLYSVFRFKDVNLDFIEQFFETSLWHDYLKSIANYGARHDRMNITVEGFFDMPIIMPSKPEQEKIAAFLSSIDKKIKLINQQLEKTRSFKKGLLQQMFI